VSPIDIGILLLVGFCVVGVALWVTRRDAETNRTNDLLRRHTEEFELYRCWAKQQRCVDCGAERKDSAMWITEIQCERCWQKYGTPERRGLPGAQAMFDEWKEKHAR
jgi:hypothetical protein